MTSSSITSGFVYLYRSNGSQVGGTAIFVSTAGRDINWPNLPADDTYTLFVDPVTYTGSVTLTLSDDLTDTISAGGSSVTATISRPGQNERVSFSGTAGENLGLGMTSTSFGGSGGTVSVYRGTSLVGLGTGYFNSSGDTSVNWSNLPATDTYTILVDPGATTGSVTLTLSDDLTSSIDVDGGPVTVAIGRAGQNARVSFNGASSQNLVLQMSGTTFGGSGGTANLYRGTSDTGLGTGYFNNSGATTRTWSSLPATDTYTIHLDPAANTGAVTRCFARPATLRPGRRR